MGYSFDPLAPFRDLAERAGRRLGFRAANLAEWETWRAALREKLAELLGGFPAHPCDLAPQVLEVRQCAGYRREKVVFASLESAHVPAYLLVPDHLSAPAPAVICLHGHGYGKDDLVGLWEDGSERAEPDGYQKDFAVEVVRRGLVAVVPEQVGFGERREAGDIRAGPSQNSCRRAAFYALMVGTTLAGLRVWDARRTLDYLETRAEVAGGRVGCMGISGGGMTALFAAALDERLRVVVVSGYLNTFVDSILALWHCECNYVPGLLRYAEMADLACLVAPRPLLVESGTRDDIFPLASADAAYAQVGRAYALLNASDRLARDRFAGRHQISGVKAYAWLERWLGEGEAEQAAVEAG